MGQNAPQVPSLDDIGNVATNLLTGGLVGMQNGSLNKGYATHAVDEGVGEVTGRNAQRKAIMDSEDAVNAEQAQRLQEQADQNLVNQNNDLQASRMAAGATRRRGTTGDVSGASPSTTDFLGL